MVFFFVLGWFGDVVFWLEVLVLFKGIFSLEEIE